MFHAMSSTNGFFIYLIGFAGTGKLTIARALRQQSDCLLVDNHLINNVVLSLVDPDGKTPLPAAVWDRVAEVRAVALATIRALSKPGRSFVFTNELLQGRPRHQQVFQDVQAVAKVRGARLLAVRLVRSSAHDSMSCFSRRMLTAWTWTSRGWRRRTPRAEFSSTSQRVEPCPRDRLRQGPVRPRGGFSPNPRLSILASWSA